MLVYVVYMTCVRVCVFVITYRKLYTLFIFVPQLYYVLYITIQRLVFISIHTRVCKTYILYENTHNNIINILFKEKS